MPLSLRTYRTVVLLGRLRNGRANSCIPSAVYSKRSDQWESRVLRSWQIRNHRELRLFTIVHRPLQSILHQFSLHRHDIRETFKPLLLARRRAGMWLIARGQNLLWSWFHRELRGINNRVWSTRTRSKEQLHRKLERFSLDTATGNSDTPYRIRLDRANRTEIYTFRIP